MRVDISGAVTEIRGHATLDLRAVHEAPLPVDLLDEPAVPGDGDALARRRRVHDRAELRGLAADGEFLVLLEDGVELEGIGEPLSRETHDQASTLGHLDVLDLDKVTQQAAQVIGAHAMEIGESQDACGELGGRELSATCERAHDLVVQQAVGKALECRRFDPVLLAI